MNKLMERISFSIIIVAGLLIIVCTYWMVYPYKVMTINEARAVNCPVKPGEELEIKINAVKHMPLPAKVLGAIENDHAYPMAELHSNTPVGMSDWTLRIKMPETIPEGEYSFHRTYVYKVNPLRSVTIDWAVPFFVKGQKDGGKK